MNKKLPSKKLLKMRRTRKQNKEPFNLLLLLNLQRQGLLKLEKTRRWRR